MDVLSNEHESVMPHEELLFVCARGLRAHRTYVHTIGPAVLIDAPLDECVARWPTPHTGWEPVNVREFEAYAKATLPKNAFDYYASGANDMITLRENRYL